MRSRVSFRKFDKTLLPSAQINPSNTEKSSMPMAKGIIQP